MADRGSDVYSDFIKTVLDAEDARKASLEQRGLAVVTTAGALVTLLFGLVSAITGATGYHLPGATHGPLIAAAVLFAFAAAFGIVVNMPFFYETPTPASLAVSYLHLWGDSVPDAELMVAATRVKLYDSSRKANKKKALLLGTATIFEVGAFVPVTIAVLDILQNAH
jgi:hypothetical protein